MESRNEGDKRKPGDFLHRKHPERREKKLHARRQYQHVPAIEQDYETNDQQHSARIPSPASLPYNGPDTPPPTSPATDCEDAPDGMQRESQNLSPRLTSSTSYDYLTTEDKQELTSLLDRKLLGIPTIHLPNLTLTDILYQSPKAVHLPHIPHDLQLSTFLSQRGAIDSRLGLAVKDATIQTLEVTRAIFFYRLDHFHHFFRYYDSARWNIVIYLSLLSSSPYISNSTRTSHSLTTSYFSPAGREFATTYLKAVLETYNSPTTFTQREDFVKLWKESRYDFFVVSKGGQRGYIRREMTRLKKEWQYELDGVRIQMGEEAYWARVAPIVGALISGQVGQERKEATVMSGVSAGGIAKEREDGYGYEKEPDASVGRERNELLEGLMVPLDDEKVVGGPRPEYETVVELSAALNAVHSSTAKGMLATLLALL